MAHLPTPGELIADVLDAFPGVPLDGLSFGRFLVLREQAGRIRNRRLLESALAARRAFHADGNEWLKFVEDLSDE